MNVRVKLMASLRSKLPADATGGGAFASFEEWGLDDSGRVVIRAGVAGGSVTEGIFAATAAGVVALAVPGAPAPGTDASYSGFSSLLVDSAGTLAFHAARAQVRPLRASCAATAWTKGSIAEGGNGDTLLTFTSHST